jgi:DMSO/TMAO reductase YedYZ molybdopterin-dependent catalytic subunit
MMPPHPGADFYTSNAHFFHPHTRPIPRLDAALWRMRVSGLGSPVQVDYATLRALPGGEIACTLAAVGSSPRFPLIGNARWGGLPLRRLLGDKIPTTTTHARFYGADGSTTTLPLDQLRESWLVYTMNGAPLPAEQGGPVRLVVPGLYDDMMPRWLQAVELVTLPPDTHPAVPTVTPLTLIFTPRPTETFTGSITFAGVAYAGLRAITQVELSIDDAPWMPVAFTQPERYSWAQWHADWQPPAPGDYLLQARGTAEDGSVTPVTAAVFRVAPL